MVDRKFNCSDSIRRGWTHDIEGRHIYTSDGVYRVVVTVTDDASASGSDSFQVVIQTPDFRALALVFEGAQLRVDFQSDATSYYILYRGIQVDYINQAVGMRGDFPILPTSVYQLAFLYRRKHLIGGISKYHLRLQCPFSGFDLIPASRQFWTCSTLNS